MSSPVSNSRSSGSQHSNVSPYAESHGPSAASNSMALMRSMTDTMTVTHDGESPTVLLTRRW